MNLRRDTNLELSKRWEYWSAYRFLQYFKQTDDLLISDTECLCC